MGNVAVSKNHLIKNLLILACTILFGWLLAQSDVFHKVLTASARSEIIGSFVGGVFFTSFFTTGPAAVALGMIARTASLPLVAVFGGAGAVIGDLILFRFLKSHLADDLFLLFGHVRNKRILLFFRLRIVHWFLMAVGALIIALPLPDEIGLVMMGLSRMKARHLISISFVLNSLGIALVGLIARAL